MNAALEKELANEKACYQTLLKHAAVLEEQRDQMERELSEAKHKLSTDGITGLRAAYDVLASEWGEAKVQRDQLRAFAQEAVDALKPYADSHHWVCTNSMHNDGHAQAIAVLSKAEPLLTREEP